jgi:pSer/pThr/pTyr-binding forkhead associated (FHA) protein
MTELFLEYKNDKGEQKRELVSGDKCVVGRHSECDIYIPDGRLSRKHLKIDRFADVFVVSDAGSSNGTSLNGEPLKEPVGLKKGDVLELGGLKLNVVFESGEPETEPPPPPEATADSGNGVSVVAVQPAAAGNASILLWVLVPVFGLIFLVFAGVVIYFVARGPTTTIAKKQDASYTDDGIDSDENDKQDTNKSGTSNPGPGTTSSPSVTNISTNGDIPSGTNTTQPGKLSETAKIEQNGGAFLRRIAANDPRAFLTTEQAAKLSSKVKQFSGSSAFADNLNSARKSSPQIKTLAESKNLKPQFLAIAAIAKLGSSRGDVLQTAQGMTDVLDKLATHLGNELADDTLLVIAAYGQGAAGEFLKMRNMLQDLANKSPASTREIRTIWFLQKNGKITQSEFENALNFLAVGTISQNPKDFGVNTEPLVL